MKKMVTTLMAVLAVMVLLSASAPAMAQEETEQGSKLSVTFPMETGATAFWFPSEGALAGGLSHTVLRASHADIPKLSLDLDGTIAQEVNEEHDTLGGIGVKLNYALKEQSEPGLSFIPNLGLTLLNDFERFSKLADIVDNYELAVYGTLLMYKW